MNRHLALELLRGAFLLSILAVGLLALFPGSPIPLSSWVIGTLLTVLALSGIQSRVAGLRTLSAYGIPAVLSGILIFHFVEVLRSSLHTRCRCLRAVPNLTHAHLLMWAGASLAIWGILGLRAARGWRVVSLCILTGAFGWFLTADVGDPPQTQAVDPVMNAKAVEPTLVGRPIADLAPETPPVPSHAPGWRVHVSVASGGHSSQGAILTFVDSRGNAIGSTSTRPFLPATELTISPADLEGIASQPERPKSIVALRRGDVALRADIEWKADGSTGSARFDGVGPGYTVRGRVADLNGNPVAQVHLLVFSVDSPAAASNPATMAEFVIRNSGHVADVSSDERGEFSVQGWGSKFASIIVDDEDYVRLDDPRQPLLGASAASMAPDAGELQSITVGRLWRAAFQVLLGDEGSPRYPSPDLPVSLRVKPLVGAARDRILAPQVPYRGVTRPHPGILDAFSIVVADVKEDWTGRAAAEVTPVVPGFRGRAKTISWRPGSSAALDTVIVDPLGHATDARVSVLLSGLPDGMIGCSLPAYITHVEGGRDSAGLRMFVLESEGRMQLPSDLPTGDYVLECHALQGPLRLTIPSGAGEYVVKATCRPLRGLVVNWVDDAGLPVAPVEAGVQISASAHPGVGPPAEGEVLLGVSAVLLGRRGMGYAYWFTSDVRSVFVSAGARGGAVVGKKVDLEDGVAVVIDVPLRSSDN